MKKIIVLFLLLFTTTVTATKTYLFKDRNTNDEVLVSNNDNYNYGIYLLEQNQILIVSSEDGILANDIIKNTNYKIKIFEDSKNSSLKDIEINNTTGAFTYTPNKSVVGEVSYKYYIEYGDKKTNLSYIYFYVKNTMTEYTINYYEQKTNAKIIPSVIKKVSVNKEITEIPINIENYKIITKDAITKQMSNKKEENNFDFYYEKIPFTGI